MRMQAWVAVLAGMLCACAQGGSRTGGSSTPDTVFSDFEACDTADTTAGADALIDRCSRALNTGLMPEDPTATALIRRGNFYAFKGDYGHAKADYDRALAMKPMASFIRGNRAVVEFLQRDYGAAFKDYDAYDGGKLDWHSLLERGIARRYRGEYDKALADFTSAYKDLSSDARILVNRGFTYVALGQYELALTDLDKALRVEPDFLPREIALVAVRGGPDKFDSAVSGYEHHITLKPDYFLLQRARGFALFMLGRSDEAAETLNAYLRSQPGDTVGQMMLDLAAGRAYTAILRDINTDPSHDQTWPRPILLALRGKGTSEDALKAAGTSDPQRECSARFYFGEADLTAKRRDAAKAAFNRALTICPQNAFERAAAAVELGRL